MTAASTQLTTEAFIQRAASIAEQSDLESLREDALGTENLYRELFARRRESWEIPEIDDPFIFLVNVFQSQHIFKRLPRWDLATPRCFELEQRDPPGSLGVSPSQPDFSISWDCLTEGLLRFIQWDNVFCAGGAVAGCLAPLPPRVKDGSPSATRVQRRKYFHDEFLPGSDIDLFLYGLNEQEAEDKLLEIYDAVQAANPYEIRAVRSAHAITLISQYPFRHVQIVLRLYNSPSEILMGFDVDACAVGYNGENVYCCPRTALAIMTQCNTVDMSRRSPSYEMRLAKYAQRGYEVIVPNLNRDRVDPFLYEKRFDQTKGLARLLLLERLGTPEERLRYRLENQLKAGNAWVIQRKLQKATREIHNVHRAEGTDGIVLPTSGPENSDYSTVFLPWGPDWSAQRTEKLMKKKDKILNKIEMLPNGKVAKCRRSYKIHVCAVGTMDEVIVDPFPDDPPIPQDVNEEALEGTVRGKLAWLVDNPGRQQIGSFHPITDADWQEGAYFSHETEQLIAAAIANQDDMIGSLLDSCDSEENRLALLNSRDFLGRSALHVAALANSEQACRRLLQYADNDLLKAKLPDGRTALHLVALKGYVTLIKLVLEKRKLLIAEGSEEDEVLDIDGADWDAKMSPLQYAVTLGHVDAVETLLSFGADARKIAVHKDLGKSISILSLLALYSTECGKAGSKNIEPMLDLLLAHGASPTQIDTSGATCWHRLVASPTHSSCSALEIFLQTDGSLHSGTPRGLDIFDSNFQTPLYLATACGNRRAVSALLKHGATPVFDREKWQARLRLSDPQNRFAYHGYAANDALRCPIALACQNANGPCLEVFISHDTSLANSPIYRQESRGRRGQNAAHTVVHPLDLIEEVLSSAKGDANRKAASDAQYANLKQQVANAEERLSRAERMREKSVTNSYESHTWSLVISREKGSLVAAQKRVKEAELSAQEAGEQEEVAIRQIEEAREVLLKAGAESIKQPEPQQRVTPFSQGRNEPEEPLDPFLGITEMSSINFATARQMVHPYAYNRFSNSPQLTSREHKDALNLLSAAMDTKSNQLQIAVASAKVCIVDYFGNTPVFLSVLSRNVNATRALFGEASRQFQLHQIKQREREVEKSDDATNESSTALKDQLRRLNNLDIAAGETPRDSGPTPEEMRRVLEASEAAALQHAKADLSKPQQPMSSVSPEALLLRRSIVVPDDVAEPELLEFKRKLAKLIPESFVEDWVSHPVRLRPIELAAVRGDISMVEALLQLARDSVSVSGFHLNDDASVSESLSGSEQGSYSSECSEDHVQHSNYRMTPFQLRYLLTGEASRNPDLQGMTLLQLAIACNDVSVLIPIAHYARENTIPRGAVAFWKQEVEETSTPIDSKDKARQKQENDTILGQPSHYGDSNLIPLWLGFGQENGRKAPVHTTPLQFSLAIGAEKVTNALMRGKLDDSLLGWLHVSGEPPLSEDEYKNVINQDKDQASGIRGVAFATAWLIRYQQQVSVSLAGLAYRLVRPTALDAIGRTALFYASTDDIEDVINSAVNATTIANIGSQKDTARSVFLDTCSRKGSVTALMAASSSKDVERVKSLIKAGCQRSHSCGPKFWGPIHLAMPCTATISKNEPETWVLVRQTIEALLEGASGDEISDALLNPGSEHTALMIALNRGADEATVDFLLSKTSSIVRDLLSARDSELNSSLHLAVMRTLATGTNTSKDMEGLSLGNIEALMKVSADLGVFTLAAENSRGLTPSELALRSVSSIWGRVGNHTNVSYQRSLRHRGRGNLPQPILSSGQTSVGDEGQSIPSIGRKAITLLEMEANKLRSGGLIRTPVSFQDAQKATRKASEKARLSSPYQTQYNRYQNSMTEDCYQAEPSGPPAIVSVDLLRRSKRGWDGWPS